MGRLGGRGIEKYLTVEKGVLHFDGVSLRDLAERYGTPLIVFSERRLKENIREIVSVFRRHYARTRVFYAVKANSNLTLLRLVRETGVGAEVVSYGELAKALLAGFRPEDIVFNGPGKTIDEIRRAVELGVHSINIDSYYELRQVAAVASMLGRRAGIAVRVVPGVEAPFIKTGTLSTKFGVELDEV